MTAIAGPARCSAAQASEWARSRGAERWWCDLTETFWEECWVVGIRADVAFAQACKETGFGRFGGVIDASFHNTCGLKTRQGGANNDPDAHTRFPSWRIGIRAHVHHLHLYAKSPLDPTPDPRHFPHLAGTATTVEALSGKWAPSPTYHESIVAYVEEMTRMTRRVVIQAGHCHRKTGSIGTRSADGFTEQQFTWAVSNRAVDLLRGDGYAALVVEADVPSYSYRGDAFVAVHADGNGNPSVGGASVGYRTGDGRNLALAWKGAYRDLGWRHGFRADNYTSNLSGYYGCKRAVEQGNAAACIIEAGFLTNPTEVDELRTKDGQERCAQAIRRAVNAVFGTPQHPLSDEEDIMAADPRGAARICMREFLGRSPKTYEELNFHAGEIGRRGLNGYIEWLEAQPEALSWAKKIGAEVRSPDPG